jgi:hypothetical protein
MDPAGRIAKLKKLHALKPGTTYFANDADNPEKIVSYSHGDPPPWDTKAFTLSRVQLLGKPVRIMHPRSAHCHICTLLPPVRASPHPALRASPHPTR